MGAKSLDLVRHLSKSDLSEDTVMATDLRSARSAMVPFRVAVGFKAVPMKLVTAPDENIKLDHSAVDLVAGYGLSLAPSDMSGDYNTCRYATKGCRSACLATSGNGRYNKTQQGRIWKTRFLAENPVAFLRVLVAELDAIPVDKWARYGFTVSFRFNVLSDLPWEDIAPWILIRLRARGIKVYDYTKWKSRPSAEALGYDLSSSIHEKSTDQDIACLRRPVVVVDIKRGHALPQTYKGRPVIDGDRSDARFLDPSDAVVLLRFKAVTTTDRAHAVASGFVRSI